MSGDCHSEELYAEAEKRLGHLPDATPCATCGHEVCQHDWEKPSTPCMAFTFHGPANVDPCRCAGFALSSTEEASPPSVG